MRSHESDAASGTGQRGVTLVSPGEHGVLPVKLAGRRIR